MCGLAGFAGIENQTRRFILAHMLGTGIDARGGHAAGYVTVTRERGVTMGRRIGSWDNASTRFVRAASEGDLVIMHARYATHGDKRQILNAHPFPIRRNGEVKLYGAHNGVIWDADDSAALNGRPFSVDSKELFELLADGELAAIQGLSGYGVITWYQPGTDHVKMARLSDDSDFVICRIKGGGIVWASTWAILDDALRAIDASVEASFKVDEVGRVYHIRGNGVFLGPETGVRLSDTPTWSAGSYYRLGGEKDRNSDLWDLLATDSERWTESDRLRFNDWMAR